LAFWLEIAIAITPIFGSFGGTFPKMTWPLS